MSAGYKPGRIFFLNYILLVQSVYILCKKSMSMSEIDCAEKMLRQFVKDFQNGYGMQFMTSNIHQLLHLSDCVRELGPIYIMSCFPYENLNGIFTNLIHGTTHASLQIAAAVNFMQQMPILKSQIKENSNAHSFLAKVNHLNLAKKKRNSSLLYCGQPKVIKP